MKRFLILLAFGLARCDKLDRTYLPPPGSKFAGGSPGSIQVPLEFPKESYSTTLRPFPKLTPEDTRLTVGTDRGVPGSRFQDFGSVPSTQTPLSPFQTSYNVPSTTTSYAFSQTTTFPTSEGFETTLSPILPGVSGIPSFQPGLPYPQQGTSQGQILPGTLSPQIISGLPGQQQTIPTFPGLQTIPGQQEQFIGSQGQTAIPGYQQPGFTGQQIIPGQQTVSQVQLHNPVSQGQSVIPSYPGQDISQLQKFAPGLSQQIAHGTSMQHYPSGSQTQPLPATGHEAQQIIPGQAQSQQQSYYPGQVVSTIQSPTPSTLSGSQSTFNGYSYEGPTTTSVKYQPGSETYSSVSNVPAEQFGQHLGVQPPTQSNRQLTSNASPQGPSQSYQPNIPNQSGTFVPNVPSQNSQPSIYTNGTFEPSSQGQVYNNAPQNQVSYNQPGSPIYSSTPGLGYQQPSQRPDGSIRNNNQGKLIPNAQDIVQGNVRPDIPINENQGPYNVPASTTSPQIPHQSEISQNGYYPSQGNIPTINPQTSTPGQTNAQTSINQRPLFEQNQYQNVEPEEKPSSLTPGVQQNIYEPGTKAIMRSGINQPSGTTPSTFQSYGTTPGYYSMPGYSSSNEYTTSGGINRPQRPQADSDRNAVILSYENTLTPEGEFAFSFDTSNGIHADEAGTSTDGVKANGSYSYIGDDGKVYNVVYTADENGFLPRGDHLPTPPPVPEAIQRVIEQATRDKEAGIFHDGSYDAERYGPKKYQTSKNSYRPAPQEPITNGADIPDEAEGNNTNKDNRNKSQISSTRKPDYEGDEFDEYVRNENSHIDEETHVNTKPSRLPSQHPVNKIKGVNKYKNVDADVEEEDSKKPGLKSDFINKNDTPRRRPDNADDRKQMITTHTHDSQDYEEDSMGPNQNVNNQRQKFDEYGRPTSTKGSKSKLKTKYDEYDGATDEYQDLPESADKDIVSTKPKMTTKRPTDEAQRNRQRLDKYGRPIPNEGSSISIHKNYEDDQGSKDFSNIDGETTTKGRPYDISRPISEIQKNQGQKFDQYGRPAPGRGSASKPDLKYTEHDDSQDEQEEVNTTGRPKGTKRPINQKQKTSRPLLRTNYGEIEEPDEVTPDGSADYNITKSRQPGTGIRIHDQRKQVKKPVTFQTITESTPDDVENEEDEIAYNKPPTRPSKISTYVDGSGYQYKPPQNKFDSGKNQFPTRMPEIEQRTKRPGQYETTKTTTLQPFITPNVYRDEESDDEYLDETANQNINPSKSGDRLKPTTESYDDIDQDIGDENIHSVASRPEKPGSAKNSGTRRPYGHTTPRPYDAVYNQGKYIQKPNSRPDTYSEAPRRPSKYGEKMTASKATYSSSTTSKPYDESSKITGGNSYKSQYPNNSSTPGYNRPFEQSSQYPTSASTPGYSNTAFTSVTTEPAITRSGFNQPSRPGFNQPGSQSDYKGPGSVTIRPGRPEVYQDLPSTTYRPNYNLISERDPSGRTVDKYGRPTTQYGGSSSTNPELVTPGRPQSPYGSNPETTRPSLNYDSFVTSSPGQQGNFAPARPVFGSPQASSQDDLQGSAYRPSQTTGQVIGEDFSGPRQPQRFDPKSGYYY